MFWLITIIVSVLIIVAFFLVFVAIQEHVSVALIPAGLLLFFASFISLTASFKTETKISPFTAEMAHNILYVKVDDRVQAFDKLSDIERFKNAKETKVVTYYNLWGTVLSYNTLPPSENEISQNSKNLVD